TKIHHLELFYYVARYGGITPAARNMPYGIQPSSICEQVKELEADLGKPLYERNPFRLTPDGEQLFAFTKEFFDHVGPVTDQIRNRAHVLRIAASERIVHDYLQPMTSVLENSQAHLHCRLQAGNGARIRRWLQSEKIDLAIAGEPHHAPGSCLYTPVFTFNPVLVVPHDWPVHSADTLWRQVHP